MTLCRSYDIAFHPLILEKVRARRQHPTGELWPVKQEERGNEIINVYPWKKMELGDFFIAPIGFRSVQAMKMSFFKAAARHDFEIVVVPIFEKDLGRCLRVTVTMIGIAQYKKAASIKHGVSSVRIHDRTHAVQKRRVSVDKRRKQPKPPKPLPVSTPKIVPAPDPFLEEKPMSLEEMRAYALRDGAGE